MSETEKFDFLPQKVDVCLDAAIRSLALRITRFCITVLLFVIVISVIRRRLKQKRSSLIDYVSNIKASFRDPITINLKKTIGYAYIFNWTAAVLYSLSFINWLNILKKAIQRKYWIFAFKYTAYYIRMYSSIHSINAIMVFFGGITAVVLFIVGIYGITSGLSRVHSIPRVVKFFIPAVLSNTTVIATEVKVAFQTVNTHFFSIINFILVPAFTLTLQIAIVSHIITQKNTNTLYILPILLLVHWSYNVSIIFCRYFVFMIVDKINTPETTQITISKPEYIQGFFDICYFSLQLTCFSFLQSLSKILTKLKFLNMFGIVTKLLTICNKIEFWLLSAFQISQYLIDQSIFNVVITRNLEFAKSESTTTLSERTREVNYTDIITVQVFSCADIAAASIYSVKNFVISCILQASLILNFLLSSYTSEPVFVEFEVGVEAADLLVPVATNFTWSTILLLALYMILSSYIISIEAAYIMNKKKKIDEEALSTNKPKGLGNKAIIVFNQGMDILTNLITGSYVPQTIIEEYEESSGNTATIEFMD